MAPTFPRGFSEVSNKLRSCDGVRGDTSSEDPLKGLVGAGRETRCFAEEFHRARFLTPRAVLRQRASRPRASQPALPPKARGVLAIAEIPPSTSGSPTLFPGSSDETQLVIPCRTCNPSRAPLLTKRDGRRPVLRRTTMDTHKRLTLRAHPEVLFPRGTPPLGCQRSQHLPNNPSPLRAVRLSSHPVRGFS